MTDEHIDHDLPHLDEPLSAEEKRVREIHGFMRNQTTLAPGTTVDNRKGLWAMLVHDRDAGSVPYLGGALHNAKKYAKFRNETEAENE